MGIIFKKKETRNRLFFAGILILLTIIVYLQTDNFNENEVKAKYYEIISVVEKLYENHELVNGMYSNGDLSQIEDVRNYLEPYMTEVTVDKVINDFFHETEKRLVYASEFQEYLLQMRETDSDYNYYEVVKNSILNPGLKLVTAEQIYITKENDVITAQVMEESVYFYDENIEHFHYKRLGYPPEDIITVNFEFVEVDGAILLSDYYVKTFSEEELNQT
ncbi:hypothetical protein J2S74_005122 [Evansella vedderi]|uniref:Uncharacterized protein n=1 Tax=Evansella vedderi TaxID=38282 RepID=A0ABU0A328_9BACI|nr:hypothetical protein [Evansella vedderi]MDQ0257660.1 hypothetical protein [Evansella vedderi]